MFGNIGLFDLISALPPDEGVAVVEGLSTIGPYAVISVLIGVIKRLYSELGDERKLRMADRDKHETEKQNLNDKVLAVSRETTTAVLQNTEVQRQLVSAIVQAQEES